MKIRNLLTIGLPVALLVVVVWIARMLGMNKLHDWMEKRHHKAD